MKKGTVTGHRNISTRKLASGVSLCVTYICVLNPFVVDSEEEIDVHSKVERLFSKFRHFPASFFSISVTPVSKKRDFAENSTDESWRMLVRSQPVTYNSPHFFIS